MQVLSDFVYGALVAGIILLVVFFGRNYVLMFIAVGVVGYVLFRDADS